MNGGAGGKHALGRRSSSHLPPGIQNASRSGTRNLDFGICKLTLLIFLEYALLLQHAAKPKTNVTNTMHYGLSSVEKW